MCKIEGSINPSNKISHNFSKIFARVNKFHERGLHAPHTRWFSHASTKRTLSRAWTASTFARSLHPQAAILSAGLSVIETRLGLGGLEGAIERQGHIEISVDQTITELDLQRMQAPAVACRCERGGFNRLAPDVRNDRIDGTIRGLDYGDANQRQTKKTPSKPARSLLYATHCYELIRIWADEVSIQLTFEPQRNNGASLT